MNRRQCTECVETPRPPRRLSGTEAVVVIVVIAIGAALALAGMPVATVLELLTGAGLVGLRLTRRPTPAPAAL
ncbi:hypothetical protein CG740_38235 [Streptomyces sp. CB01201]|uniref:hypothetical protein n=1 Tax=Streptomyces sp. CB01201 TaxID=2020324 RepID=UPI000C27D7A7|nr:hypothetical protein [Streptomyces sp. CB01201]PJM98010.1 hypothetical protein CG740_38235 [Streptomyces sp. CB01201]